MCLSNYVSQYRNHGEMIQVSSFKFSLNTYLTLG